MVFFSIFAELITFTCSIITELLRYVAYIYVEHLTREQTLTFVPKMCGMLRFQSVYLGAWGQV